MCAIGSADRGAVAVTGREHIFVDGKRVEINVPVSGSENVMIPVVRMIVRQPGIPIAEAPILLQRRDGNGEPVRGLLEIPGGRWRSGESPAVCAAREIEEETGVVISEVDGVKVDRSDGDGALAVARPLAVVSGTDGRFPAAHMILTGVGEGPLRGEAGATVDVRWWELADVRSAIVSEPGWFVPSSRAALTAYVAEIDSLA